MKKIRDKVSAFPPLAVCPSVCVAMHVFVCLCVFDGILQNIWSDPFNPGHTKQSCVTSQPSFSHEHGKCALSNRYVMMLSHYNNKIY